MKYNSLFMLIILVGISHMPLQGFAQELEFICGEELHGVGHVHVSCPEEIIITSTQDEEGQGSIIDGWIAIDEEVEHLYGITILPGPYGVRIVPENEYLGIINHSTTIGNGNGKGLPIPIISKKTQNKPLLENLSPFPNPFTNELTLNQADVSIDLIKIYNYQGELLVEEENLSSTPTLFLGHLKPGLYLLKAYMANGESINKTIVKTH